jgi:hypothetical protein
VFNSFIFNEESRLMRAAFLLSEPGFIRFAGLLDFLILNSVLGIASLGWSVSTNKGD